MRKFCCSGKINPVQKPVKSISPIISTVIIIIIVVFAGIFTEGYVMGYFSNMHRDPPPEAVYIYQYAKDGVINLGLQVISDSPEIQLENTSFLINASTGQIATPLDISPTILNASSLNQITGRPENNVPNGYYYVKLLTRTGYVLCSEIFQINGLNTWSTPAGVLYVQQINITNTQSSKTVMPFDQRITLPPTPYANAKYSNVLFFDSKGSLLYSWLENYSGSGATYWVKLPYGVPAQTTVTIYAGYGELGANFFQEYQGFVGESPVLSVTGTLPNTSYGMYDNGLQVFYVYQNFTGIESGPNAASTYTVTNWTAITPNHISIHDGMVLEGFSRGASIYTRFTPINTGVMVLSYVVPLSVSKDANDYTNLLGTYSDSQKATNWYTSQGYGLDLWHWGTIHGITQKWNGIIYYTNDSRSKTLIGNCSTFNLPAVNQPYITEFQWVPGKLYGEVGGCSITAQSSTLNPSSANMLELQAIYDGGAQAATTYEVYWVLIAPAPPNGIMPNVTFGMVTSTSS